MQGGAFRPAEGPSAQVIQAHFTEEHNGSFAQDLVPEPADQPYPLS